jgi:hypothetical protein
MRHLVRDREAVLIVLLLVLSCAAKYAAWMTS